MSKYSVNRPTGLICNFYQVGDELETSVRKGFSDFGARNSKKQTHYGEDIRTAPILMSGVTWAEAHGAKLFRKRFGRERTREEALRLISEFGLAIGEIKPEDALYYLTQSDIPFRRRSFFGLGVDDWDKFTLITERKREFYRLNGDYGIGDMVGGFFRGWGALISLPD